MGPRNVATGGATRPLCGPSRNPWKAESPDNRYSSFSFRPSGAKGVSEPQESFIVGQAEHHGSASCAGDSSAPHGAGVSKTHLFHGLRAARLQRAALHPWLHAVAPSGLIRIRNTAGQGRPCRRPAPPRRIFDVAGHAFFDSRHGMRGGCGDPPRTVQSNPAGVDTDSGYTAGQGGRTKTCNRRALAAQWPLAAGGGRERSARKGRYARP
jgi:hypothetical protein